MPIMYVLQGDYGSGHGWEDIAQSYDRDEMVEDRQAYRDNAPEYRYRIDPRVEECSHRAVAGMMYVHDEDLETVARDRLNNGSDEIECEKCDARYLHGQGWCE